MKKIIKHRNKPEINKTYLFKCRCGCEFEADREDYQPHSSPKNECFVKSDCPECGVAVYEDEANFITPSFGTGPSNVFNRRGTPQPSSLESR